MFTQLTIITTVTLAHPIAAHMHPTHVSIHSPGLSIALTRHMPQSIQTHTTIHPYTRHTLSRHMCHSPSRHICHNPSRHTEQFIQAHMPQSIQTHGTVYPGTYATVHPGTYATAVLSRSRPSHHTCQTNQTPGRTSTGCHHPQHHDRAPPSDAAVQHSGPH